MITVHYTKAITGSGDFQKVEGINNVMDSLANLLLIQKGTYPFDPEYGTDLPKYVFNLDDELTVDTLKAEIKSTLEKEPDITVGNVSFSKTAKGVLIEADVTINLAQKIKAKFNYNPSSNEINNYTYQEVSYAK